MSQYDGDASYGVEPYGFGPYGATLEDPLVPVEAPTPTTPPTVLFAIAKIVTHVIRAMNRLTQQFKSDR